MIVYFFIFCLFICYIFARLTCGKTRSNMCLLGKTAIVTGANSGIGYQTALNLASRGCRVIMADISDMNESKEKIMKYTNNSNIVTKNIDLSSLESVRSFARDINQNEERLHILINNAGIGASREEKTKDGLDAVMQINYFSHFLLTHLLIDLLKKSAPSRIVFTSSITSFYSNLSFENLNGERKCLSFGSGFTVYSNSKLALLVASDGFAAKLKESGVTSNSLHPGFVSTIIYEQFLSIYFGRLGHVVCRLLFSIYAKDVWEGSQTLVHIAVSKKLENVTGKHFWDCKPFFKPTMAYNKDFCRTIWETTEKYVNLKPEEKI